MTLAVGIDHGNGPAQSLHLIDALLPGVRSPALTYRASETSPEGPLHAQCPACRLYSRDDELPLTITSTGHLRCSHSCDPDEIIDWLLRAAANGDERRS
jgi:hypothetical protein